MSDVLNTEDLELSDDAFDLAFDAAAEAKDVVIDAPDVSEELTLEKEEPLVVEKEEPLVVEKEAPLVVEKEAPLVVEKEAPLVVEAKAEPKPDPVAEAAAKKAQDDAEAAAKKAQDDAEAAALKATQDAQALESLSDEETAVLTQAKEDFPELIKVVEAVQRTTIAKMENMYSARLKELEDKLSTQMAPALQSAQVQANNAHEAFILKAHPDAPTMIDPVEKWVATKPAFLQTTYNAVLDKGTAQDVVELFNLYKAETGSAQTPSAPVVDAEKEKRLKAQEGVKGRNPGGRAAAVDPDDFEGAFEKFAATA